MCEKERPKAFPDAKGVENAAVGLGALWGYQQIQGRALLGVQGKKPLEAPQIYI